MGCFIEFCIKDRNLFFHLRNVRREFYILGKKIHNLRLDQFEWNNNRYIFFNISIKFAISARVINVEFFGTFKMRYFVVTYRMNSFTILTSIIQAIHIYVKVNSRTSANGMHTVTLFV